MWEESEKGSQSVIGETRQEKQMQQDWDSSGEGKGRLRLDGQGGSPGREISEKRSQSTWVAAVRVRHLVPRDSYKGITSGVQEEKVGAEEGNKEHIHGCLETWSRLRRSCLPGRTPYANPANSEELLRNRWPLAPWPSTPLCLVSLEGPRVPVCRFLALRPWASPLTSLILWPLQNEGNNHPCPARHGVTWASPKMREGAVLAACSELCSQVGVGTKGAPAGGGWPRFSAPQWECLRFILNHRGHSPSKLLHSHTHLAFRSNNCYMKLMSSVHT